MRTINLKGGIQVNPLNHHGNPFLLLTNVWVSQSSGLTKNLCVDCNIG